jgi:hypothetical protein
VDGLEAALIPIIGNPSNIEHINESRERDLLKELSDKLIDGGADFLYFSFGNMLGKRRITDKNLYKEFIGCKSPLIKIHSSSSLYDGDNFGAEQILFQVGPLHTPTSPPDKRPHIISHLKALPYHINNLLFNKKKGMAPTSLFIKVGSEDTLLSRLTISAVRKKRDHNEFIDFRYMGDKVGEEVYWGFEAHMIIPLQHISVVYLISKKYDLHDIAYYCKKPKIVNDKLSYDEIVSIFSSLFGNKRHFMELHFPRIPPHVSNTIKDYFESVKTGNKGEYSSYENYMWKKLENSNITYYPNEVLENFTHPHISLWWDDSLDRRIYDLFKECVKLLKENNVALHHNRDIKKIFGKLSSNMRDYYAKPSLTVSYLDKSHKK